MGYQALLFCPDEKTARAVTLVLADLDFETIACTEPFGAVKKLMAQHFDAVVVDCDNEQNATLLFKSARNAPNNLTALAVAVVEGQAGVAKAFRIGANLVLTKPINIEQAKGTLRVARGLLRKNEAAKAASSTVPAPAKSVDPIPAAPAAKISIARPEPKGPVWPQTPTEAPVWAPASKSVATGPSLAQESVEAESISAPTPESLPKIGANASLHAAQSNPSDAIAAETKPAPVARLGSSTANWGGTASAPAPALEKPIAAPAAEKAAAAVLPAPAAAIEEIKASVVESPAEEIVAVAEPEPAPTEKSKSAGSKKGLLIVLAIALIAAAGYFAWTQWESWKKPVSVPVVVPVHAVPPAPVPQTLVKPDASPATVPSTQAPSSQLPPSVSAPASSSAPATVPAVEETKPHPRKELNSSDPPASTANPAKPKAKNSILMPAKSKPSQLDASAPSINAIVAGNNSALPNLALSAERVPTPVLASKSGFTQGTLIKQVPPQYPSKAMQMNIEGPVQLLATVSKKGDVSAVKVLSGNAALSAAASDAVRQWKYKPFLLNGDPVEIQVPVTVKFKLP